MPHPVDNFAAAVIFPSCAPPSPTSSVSPFSGKMKVRRGPDCDQGQHLWATRTVSACVYKGAFEWTTVDLGTNRPRAFGS